MLGIIQKEKKYAYILGDFNVNTLDELTGRSLDSQTFINLFSAHYYRKLIDVPTRVVENSFTLLDNVYTNCPITESSGVLKTDITDHYSIFTVRDHLEPITDYVLLLTTYRCFFTFTFYMFPVFLRHKSGQINFTLHKAGAYAGFLRGGGQL